MADEIRRDANGYDYAMGPGPRLAREQVVKNETWPLRDKNGWHARGIDDQPAEKQIAVRVRLVLERDGEVVLPGRAARWNASHVFVIVDDERVPRGQVWVRAGDVERA